jgi:hypothetical protein
VIDEHVRISPKREHLAAPPLKSVPIIIEDARTTAATAALIRLRLQRRSRKRCGQTPTDREQTAPPPPKTTAALLRVVVLVRVRIALPAPAVRLSEPATAPDTQTSLSAGR